MEVTVPANPTTPGDTSIIPINESGMIRSIISWIVDCTTFLVSLKPQIRNKTRLTGLLVKAGELLGEVVDTATGHDLSQLNLTLLKVCL